MRRIKQRRFTTRNRCRLPWRRLPCRLPDHRGKLQHKTAARSAAPQEAAGGTHRADSASLRVFRALNMARWLAGTLSAKAAQSMALTAVLRAAMTLSCRERRAGHGRQSPEPAPPGVHGTRDSFWAPTPPTKGRWMDGSQPASRSPPLPFPSLPSPLLRSPAHLHRPLPQSSGAAERRTGSPAPSASQSTALAEMRHAAPRTEVLGAPEAAAAGMAAWGRWGRSPWRNWQRRKGRRGAAHPVRAPGECRDRPALARPRRVSPALCWARVPPVRPGRPPPPNGCGWTWAERTSWAPDRRCAGSPSPSCAASAARTGPSSAPTRWGPDLPLPPGPARVYGVPAPSRVVRPLLQPPPPPRSSGAPQRPSAATARSRERNFPRNRDLNDAPPPGCVWFFVVFTSALRKDPSSRALLDI